MFSLEDTEINSLRCLAIDAVSTSYPADLLHPDTGSITELTGELRVSGVCKEENSSCSRETTNVKILFSRA